MTVDGASTLAGVVSIFRAAETRPAGGDRARAHPCQAPDAAAVGLEPIGDEPLRTAEEARWQTSDRLAAALRRRCPRTDGPEAVAVQLGRQLAFLTYWLASVRPFVAVELIERIDAHCEHKT